MLQAEGYLVTPIPYQYVFWTEPDTSNTCQKIVEHGVDLVQNQKPTICWNLQCKND